MNGNKYTCQYCKAEFSYKRTLDKHLNSTRYCLQQRLNNSDIKCICNSKLLSQSDYDEHKKQCIAFQYSNKYKLIEEQNVELIELNKKLSDEIIYLKGQLDIVKYDKEKYYATVEKAALDKKTVNNNNYNSLITFPILDKQRLNDKCKLINKNIVRSGQVALANFFVSKVATNDKGEIGVICTDKSRRIFKYMREDGKIITDIEAYNMIKSFKESSSIYIEKSLEQIKKEYGTNDLYETEDEKLDAYYKVADEARAFGGPFVAQLIKKTYKREEDGTLTKIDPPNPIST